VRLRISSGALQDLNAIFDYIANDNPDAAARTIEQILESAERLLEYPNLGQAGRVKGTRELVRRPFVIVYRVLEDVISIGTVLHGCRIQSEP
jgi:toxin ParE1/3/4